MAIVATKGGNGTFTPHPEGPFAALCVDVHDLGMVEVVWEGTKKQQRKVDLYFFCGEYKEDDSKTPLLVRSRFTLSLADASRLRPFLQAWRGKPFTPEEEAGFDLEKLLMAPAFLQVSHNIVNGKTYANIDAIMRMPKAMNAPDLPADFIRPSQRPRDEAAPGASSTPTSAGSGQYSDVPTGEPDYGFPNEDDLPF